MIRLSPPVSAYLVKPTVHRNYRPDWKHWRRVGSQILKDNPHLFGRSLMALAVWCLIVGTYQTATGFSLTSSNSSGLFAGPGLASSSTSTKVGSAISPANIAAAQRAQSLPSGPSGQLLPPGTMAPDFTFSNTYARGQCTWYVAGRRQIPRDWGNARTWYSHAVALHWSVGTVPAIAAIAWTSAGTYGHVALVEQVSADGKSVYVSEMNYRAIGVKSFRWAPATDFKYIY